MATDYSALGPWAGAAAATYDRDFENKQQRQTQNALAGYGTDPDTAIKNLYAINAPAAMELQQRLQTQRTTTATTQREQAYKALTGATDMLRKARDTGGDVGATYDQLDHAGILDSLGMTPPEKAQYRAAITTNPALIDIIGQKAAEGVVVAPGAQLLDKATGRVMGSTPAVPKPLVVRRGDGGSDVIYPTAPGGAPGMTPGAAPGAKTPLTVEALRPVFKAQESSGDYTVTNRDTGALGAYQIMPNTGAALAKKLGVAWRPDMMTKNDPASVRYQDAIGGAAIADAISNSGGDPATAFSYYYGGADRSKWGPKTRQYTADMMGRMGGGQTANAAPQSGVAYSTPGAPPKAQPKRMTPAEVAAEGLDPSIVYYRGADGVPNAVDGQTKPNAQLKPWPQTPAKAYVENQAAITNIDRALKLFDPNNKSKDARDAQGAVGYGTGTFGDNFTNWRDPQGTAARALVGQIGGVIIKDISGAAVSATEDERLAKWVPKVTDNAATIRTKLQNLRNELTQKQSAMETYFSEDQGYRPVGGATPAAGASEPVKVRTVQQAMALPPGTVFITPDGRRKVR